MSNERWQTDRQIAQLQCGNTITEKVEKYIEVWKERCYDDLPDKIPEKLAKTNRAPSYKSIAIAILRNDHYLKSLGFVSKENETTQSLRRQSSPQKELFQ